MRYWKFLRPGAVGPFTGFRWMAGDDSWAAATELRGGLLGVHACRARDLPYWLTEELWQIELAGEVREHPDKVVATRGRLVRQVTAWGPATMTEFAHTCLSRVLGHAAAELHASRLPGVADRLHALVRPDTPVTGGSGRRSLLDLAEVTGAALAAAESAEVAGRRQAAVLCGYVADAAEAVTGYPVASVAYIAARAANQRSTATDVDPYLAERDWQARWLIDRLGLDGATG